LATAVTFFGGSQQLTRELSVARVKPGQQTQMDFKNTTLL
jgi:hypothetical protein